jgi:hypothetical protein
MPPFVLAVGKKLQLLIGCSFQNFQKILYLNVPLTNLSLKEKFKP